MNCTEFERILNESIESRRPADMPSLREHAAGCAACRTLWEQYAVLERAIPLWKNRVPDVDLTDAVLARAAVRADAEKDESESPQDPVVRRAPEGEAFPAGTGGGRSRPAVTSRRRVWHLVTLLAIGAAVLVLLVRSVMFPTGSDRQTPTTIVKQDSGKAPLRDTPQQPQNEAHAEIDTLLRDAGSAYVVLARGAADALAEVRVFAPGGARESVSPGNGGSFLPGTSDALKQWSRGLKPIGQDLEDALDFLFEAVPLEAAPTT